MKDGAIYFLGCGNVQMARLDANDVPMGYDDPINCTRLELNVDTDTKEVKSKMRDTCGQILASATRINDTTVAMTFNGTSPSLFANVFLGDLVDITDAGGSKSGEEVTAHAGKWSRVSTPGSGISSVVVKDHTDATTYVDNTDYALDATSGLIKPLDGGAINDGDVLHVDYAYGAMTGSKITGATRPLVNVAIIFSGKNVFDDSQAAVEILKASLRPSSPVDFLSDDPQELQFEGKMITPAGKSWPFEVR